jgi:hypothetical protein
VGTFSNGNLQVTRANAYPEALSTINVNGGKFYAEATITSQVAEYIILGVVQNPSDTASPIAPLRHSPCVGYRTDGQKNIDLTYSAYGASFTVNDVIGIAVDVPGNSITFYKSGVSQGAISYTFSSKDQFFACGGTGTAGLGNDTVVFNFGQRPFAYTAPSGFKALCTTNLPEPTIADGGEYFNTVLYTGDGTAIGSGGKTVTGVGFQSDFTWIKSRSNSYNHRLIDSVRGAPLELQSNLTDAEVNRTEGLNNWTSDGFVVGNAVGYNANAETYVGWNWKANGAGVSNTAGTITSTVSANTDSGFSIVTYTGNGTDNATFGHGLGVKPAMVIIKSRSDGSQCWNVWHQSLASENYFLWLNATNSVFTAYTSYQKSKTSSVVTLGTNVEVNASGGTYVAYCFAPVAGYSAFGSYTGNGSTDGPFVYTGFRPRYVMYKRTDSTANWSVLDTSRSPYNVSNEELYPDLADAEIIGTTRMDILSNGFKIRNGAGAAINANGGTYIYACFAENPFKLALAR